MAFKNSFYGHASFEEMDGPLKIDYDQGGSDDSKPLISLLRPNTLLSKFRKIIF